MNDNSQLLQFRQYIEEGKLELAQQGIKNYLQMHPGSEQGWSLLYRTVLTTDQKKYCLEQILAINPNNQSAQRLLEQIEIPSSKSYITSHLTPGEKLVHFATLHWGIFVIPLLKVLGGSLFALALLVPGGSPNAVRCLCIIGALIIGWGFFNGLSFLTSYLNLEVIVTNKRILTKTGTLTHQISQLRLSQVESASFHQPFLGRVLGYGDVEVIGSGGTRITFSDVADPARLHYHIQAALG